MNPEETLPSAPSACDCYAADCYMSGDPQGHPTATYMVPVDADMKYVRECALQHFDRVVFQEASLGQSPNWLPAEWERPLGNPKCWWVYNAGNWCKTTWWNVLTLKHWGQRVRYGAA